MRSIRNGAVLAILIPSVSLLASACGDSNSSKDSMAGTYVLATVEGSPVPALIDPGTLLQTDTLTIKSDGTFTDALNLQDINEAGFIPHYSSGSYTVSDSLLTLGTANGGFSFVGNQVGIRSGQALTFDRHVSDGAGHLEFRKVEH